MANKKKMNDIKRNTTNKNQLYFNHSFKLNSKPDAVHHSDFNTNTIKLKAVQEQRFRSTEKKNIIDLVALQKSGNLF